MRTTFQSTTAAVLGAPPEGSSVQVLVTIRTGRVFGRVMCRAGAIGTVVDPGGPLQNMPFAPVSQLPMIALPKVVNGRVAGHTNIRLAPSEFEVLGPPRR